MKAHQKAIRCKDLSYVEMTGRKELVIRQELKLSSARAQDTGSQSQALVLLNLRLKANCLQYITLFFIKTG